MDEKERKKKWYLDNKERLKSERTTKKAKAGPPKKVNNFIVLTFLAVVVLISSGILVVFSAEVIGKSFTGWATAILLEIGILSLAIMYPKKTWELWVVKISFAFFVAVSFLILHTGAQSPVSMLRFELAEDLKKNAINMPENHSSKRHEALVLAAKSLDSVGTGTAVVANLGTRVVLLLLNLIFCHAFVRGAGGV